VTLHEAGKQIRVIGVYVGFAFMFLTAGWVSRAALTGEGILFPAAAARRIGATEDSIGEHRRILTAQEGRLTVVETQLGQILTGQQEQAALMTTMLRVLCLNPDFSRSVECRRVYR
jgi:hypothetical protein